MAVPGDASSFGGTPVVVQDSRFQPQPIFAESGYPPASYAETISSRKPVEGGWTGNNSWSQWVDEAAKSNPSQTVFRSPVMTYDLKSAEKMGFSQVGETGIWQRDGVFYNKIQIGDKNPVEVLQPITAANGSMIGGYKDLQDADKKALAKAVAVMVNQPVDSSPRTVGAPAAPSNAAPTAGDSPKPATAAKAQPLRPEALRFALEQVGEKIESDDFAQVKGLLKSARDSKTGEKASFDSEKDKTLLADIETKIKAAEAKLKEAQASESSNTEAKEAADSKPAEGNSDSSTSETHSGKELPKN